MGSKVTAALDDSPLRTSTVEFEPRQKTSPDGGLIEHAAKCARIETKELAEAMGVSHSFLLRGFKDQEHISWQRLQRAAAKFPQFKRWLLIVQAADTEDVHVRTVIDVEACGRGF